MELLIIIIGVLICVLFYITCKSDEQCKYWKDQYEERSKRLIEESERTMRWNHKYHEKCSEITELKKEIEELKKKIYKKYKFDTATKDCKDCPCLQFNDVLSFCGITGKEVYYIKNIQHCSTEYPRPDWCPLVDIIIKESEE